MLEKNRIMAIICALTLAVNAFGAYADDADAAAFPVTADDAGSDRRGLERGDARNIDAKAVIQQLESGKKVQGRLVSGDDGQKYQVTLKSSGQLDINLEGDIAKLSGYLTDQKGKGWDPRKAAGGKYTYQLNKGTYYYQVQAEKGAEIPETGLEYAITATFQSAKAKFEDNTTRKKAAKLPFKKVFYGHLASNVPEEYYKFTLDKQSYFSFSLTTQITDNTPETFVVTLYNKQGQPMSSWGNPDWVEYFKPDQGFGVAPDAVSNYDFKSGNWYKSSYYYGAHDRGVRWVLPAGEYYVGVSVKKDKDGKVPASARYGRYAACAASWSASTSVRLSRNQAEYTGKKINPPKVTVKKLTVKKQKHAALERITSNVKGYGIYSMTTGDLSPLKGIKKIGRYMIEQDAWMVDPEFGDDDTKSYKIFTVTPVRGKIRGVSSKNPGKVQVSLKKNAQSTGYQIQIARDKKFKKSRRTVKTANIRETIKGLSSGKKYYIRVRNYKDVKTSYGEWCLNLSSGDTPWDMLNIPVQESIYGKWSKTRTIVCK